MAAPRNNAYAVASGAGVYAGRAAPSGLPSWVTSAVSGRWGVVPVAAALSTLNPRDNPAINPAHPGNPEWYLSGHPYIVTAWCGACFDEDGDALWLPLSGGHADYAGNEPYKLALNQEVPAWTMVRAPSGAVGNLLTTNDGQEASGVYADGQPRSIHSYNKPCYVPGVGPFIVSMGNTSWSGQAGPNKPVKINPNTGLGTLMATCTGASLGGGGRISCSAFDPTRGAQGSIWGRGSGFFKLQRYDVAADSWTQEIGSSTNSNGYQSLCYLPAFDCLLFADADGLKVFDCATSTWHTPSVTGTGAATWSACQLVHVTGSGHCYTWNNASDTTLITRIALGANPRTALTVDTLAVDGGNAVTPTAKTANGTYGRFTYSPNLGLFILMNSTSGSVYFFKP